MKWNQLRVCRHVAFQRSFRIAFQMDDRAELNLPDLATAEKDGITLHLPDGCSDSADGAF